VVLGAAVVVGAAAQARHGHLVHVREAVGRLAHREQPARLLPFTLDLRLWGAGKAELVAEARLGLVGVALHQVRAGVTRTSAVDDLLGGVVRVDNVGPGHVPEVLAPLQLLHGLAELVLLGPVVDGVPVPGVGGGGAGGPGAPALPLQPRRPVGVQLPAHAVRRAHWQIRFRTPCLEESFDMIM